EGAESLQDLERKLTAPRTVWLILPAGDVTGRVLRDVAELLSHGDIVVDGGNSRYTDDIARGGWLAERSVEFVDCGTSGAVWGEERGNCLMICGRKDIVDLEPIFAILAPGQDSVAGVADRNGNNNSAEQGYSYYGATGAAHFVKMV